MQVYFSLSPLPFASLLSSAMCKASSVNHFAFLHFFFLEWFWSLPPVQCYKHTSIVLQALCLPDLILWTYSLPLLYNHKGFFFRSYLNGLVVFPYILQLKPEFCNKELMIWATVSFRSCFCWLYRASPSLAAKNIISLISETESSLGLFEKGVSYDQHVLLTKLC